MPTPLPSSFASAAAGNAHDASKRGDVSASGEWYALFPGLGLLMRLGVDSIHLRIFSIFSPSPCHEDGWLGVWWIFTAWLLTDVFVLLFAFFPYIVLFVACPFFSLPAN